jgi:hypothetical protein
VIKQITDQPTDWPNDLQDNWFTEQPSYWPTNWLTDLSTDYQPTNWLTDQPTERPTNRLTIWLTDQMTNFQTELIYLINFQTELPTDWPNYRITAQSNDWPTNWLVDWLTNQPTEWQAGICYSRIFNIWSCKAQSNTELPCIKSESEIYVGTTIACVVYRYNLFWNINFLLK